MKKMDWMTVAGGVVLLGALGYAAWMFFPRQKEMTIEPEPSKTTPIPTADPAPSNPGFVPINPGMGHSSVATVMPDKTLVI